MKFLGDIDTSNLLLLDVKYGKAENGVDYAMLLLKNVVTGKKFVHSIPEPKMEIYFVKDEYRDFDYNQTAMKMDKLYPVQVPYRKVLSTIAKEAGGKWKNYYLDCMENKQYRAARNIFHYEYSFGADLDICDYYRSCWALHYNNPELKYHIHKVYLDIESDVVDYVGKPPIGAAKVNAVSVTDPDNKTVSFFGLRNAAKENPQIAYFEAHIEDFYKMCHEEFDENFPGMKYQVYMFDTERELLIGLFQLLKEIDPDMIGIWNMAYDVQSLIARAKENNLDPYDLFCSNDFPAKELYYWEDKLQGRPLAKKSYFLVSSRAIWTDMMLNYGKLRKGGSVIRSVKLNKVAKDEIEDEKLDYTGSYDKFLPYTNYMKFALYNMKDTLLLDGIEKKTEDFASVLTRCLVNGASYRAVFSQTKFLKSRFYIECYLEGYIAGNNFNMDYAKPFNDEEEEDEEKYDGAVVGDPELNEKVGTKVFGKPSKYIFRYVIDEDFSSFYPWTTISYNISPATMLGKLLIDDQYYHGNVKSVYEDDPALKFECGKEFVENYITKDVTRLGMNWFNLPSIEEMVKELDEK